MRYKICRNYLTARQNPAIWWRSGKTELPSTRDRRKLANPYSRPWKRTSSRWSRYAVNGCTCEFLEIRAAGFVGLSLNSQMTLRPCPQAARSLLRYFVLHAKKLECFPEIGSRCAAKLGKCIEYSHR